MATLVIRNVVFAGMLLVLVCFLVSPQLYLHGQALTQISFTPEDKFAIPQFNSTISFASNGSCSEATLKDGSWTFKDLKLDSQNTTFLGINASRGLGDLKISAQNSNVTVWNCISINYSIPIELLAYYVEGEGNQTFNLAINASRSSTDEWSVIVSDSAFLPVGQNWRLLPDGSVTVWGKIGNITVAHFGFNSEYRNLSFFLQHYVGIFTAVTLIAVVSVAAVVKFRPRYKVH